MRVYFEGEEDTETRYDELTVDFINTYGGESWVDDFEIREYGIQLGNLSISELTPEEFKNLGVQIIRHLMLNGHRFEIKNDRQGNGDYLKAL